LKAYWNRIVRRMRGPDRGEIIGGWRKLRNKEFHNTCSSLNIIKVINLRRIRWAGNVTRTVSEKCVYNFGHKTWIKKERVCLGDLGIDVSFPWRTLHNWIGYFAVRNCCQYIMCTKQVGVAVLIDTCIRDLPGSILISG
jgi:hypothetical protein